MLIRIYVDIAANRLKVQYRKKIGKIPYEIYFVVDNFTVFWNDNSWQ